MSERWMPERGEKYYWSFFYHCNTGSTNWSNSNDDFDKYALGNCFRTREEAEAAAEKVRVLLLSLHDITQDKPLPKLTTEVFDRPDCPYWAKYAAVDCSGVAYWHEDVPFILGKCWMAKPFAKTDHISSVLFDASDWQYSLIERPVKETKLPEWCKNGALAWENGDYFELEVIDEDHQITMKYSDGTEESVIADYIGKHVKQARLRPYNAEEMMELVGKVLRGNDTNFRALILYADVTCEKIETLHYDYGAEELARSYNIDGKPCGILEHLENGEWVK